MRSLWIGLCAVVLGALLFCLWSSAPDPTAPELDALQAAATKKNTELKLPPVPSQPRGATPTDVGRTSPEQQSSPPNDPELGPPEEAAGEEPEDPIELGACTLELRVFDRLTGEPVATGAELWRLEAPGNQHWTAGDQLQAKQLMEHGRGRFFDLPAGRYRVRADARRLDSADPPAFEVRAPNTEVALQIDLPRSYRVFVDVRDAAGLYVGRASVLPASDSHSIEAPSWRTERRLREGSPEAVSTAVEWNIHGDAVDIDAGPRGFELGEFREATARSGGSRHVKLSFEAQSSVKCPLLMTPETDARYLAVCVPLSAIRAAVRLEDGRSLGELPHRIEASCTAVPILDSSAAPDWRQVPIDVRVDCGGFQPLQFELRLAEWPLRERVLMR
jgi:hypothetical protein